MINVQYIILFHYFREVLKHANKRGIEMAPLKGAHFLTSIYPPSEDRGPLADIDFLVQEDDWNRAVELMISIGFILRQTENRQVSQRKYHEAVFFSKLENGQYILFEAHRQFVQPSRHPVNYNDVWDRAYSSTFEGVPCKRLCDTDHLLHLVIHLFSHRFSCLKRSMRDLELLVNAGNIEYKAIVPRAIEWKCTRALWLTLSLYKKKTNSERFDKIIQQVRPPLPVRLLLKLLVTNEKEFLFKEIGLRKEQLILWTLLMDDSHQSGSFLFSFLNSRIRDLLEK